MEVVVKEFIGLEIRFDCQPYDTGRGRITGITPGQGMWSDYWVVEVEVIEGKTRNRLLGHVSYTDIRPGSTRTMYHYSRDAIQRAIRGDEPLIHVYPV